jgi:hypothetical protein
VGCREVGCREAEDREVGDREAEDREAGDREAEGREAEGRGEGAERPLRTTRLWGRGTTTICRSNRGFSRKGENKGCEGGMRAVHAAFVFHPI